MAIEEARDELVGGLLDRDDLGRRLVVFEPRGQAATKRLVLLVANLVRGGDERAECFGERTLAHRTELAPRPIDEPAVAGVPLGGGDGGAVVHHASAQCRLRGVVGEERCESQRHLAVIGVARVACEPVPIDLGVSAPGDRDVVGRRIAHDVLQSLGEAALPLGQAPWQIRAPPERGEKLRLVEGRLDPRERSAVPVESGQQFVEEAVVTELRAGCQQRRAEGVVVRGEAVFEDALGVGTLAPVRQHGVHEQRMVQERFALACQPGLPGSRGEAAVLVGDNLGELVGEALVVRGDLRDGRAAAVLDAPGDEGRAGFVLAERVADQGVQEPDIGVIALKHLPGDCGQACADLGS